MDTTQAVVLSRFDLFIYMYTACTVIYKDNKPYNIAFFNFDKHLSVNYGKPELRITNIKQPETSDQPDRETCALKCHYL
jgi:hypothetical protein